MKCYRMIFLVFMSFFVLFPGSIPSKALSGEFEEYNPYLEKLLKNVPLIKTSVKSVQSHNYGEIVGYRPDFPKMMDTLKKSHPDVIFQIKQLGEETNDPVDDFIGFLRQTGLLVRKGISSYDGDAIPQQGHPLYFALLLKGDQFNYVRQIAQSKFSDGKIFSMHINPKGCDHHLYIVRIDKDPWTFLNVFHNSKVRNLRLEHDEGEKLFFIPGRLPEISFDVHFKDGTFRTVAKATNVSLEEPALFKQTKRFSLSDVPDLMNLDDPTDKRVEFLLKRKEFKDFDKAMDFLRSLAGGSSLKIKDEEGLKYFIKDMEGDDAGLHRDNFDRLEISLRLWQDPDLIKDLIEENCYKANYFVPLEAR